MDPCLGREGLYIRTMDPFIYPTVPNTCLLAFLILGLRLYSQFKKGCPLQTLNSKP